MSQIITIAGSPAGAAKSAAVLNHTQRLLRRRRIHTSAIAVWDLPPADLMSARLNSPAIQEAQCSLEEARGVIIATPVYKAAYSGVLKAFLDLLPRNALQDKVILPIATGGCASHLPALDYALKPVLAALGACHILRGVYMTEEQIQFEHGGSLRLDDEVEARLQAGLDQLVAAVTLPKPLAALRNRYASVYEPATSPATSLEVRNLLPMLQSQQASPYEAPILLEGFER